MDDDPFAVVAPTEKKMSSYLKKSKGPSSSKCVETSSHGTNSTRSTTNSTLPPEDTSFFSPKNNDFPSKKSPSSGFNNSGSSDSANFEFGNGLEFGQGFGGSGFADDAFGIGIQDQKSKSSRKSSTAPDPFLAPPPSKSVNNFGSTKNDFDAFDAPAAPQSMRNFGSTIDDFDAFDAPPVPQSMRNFGSTSTDDFDAFDAPPAPQSMRNLGSAGKDFDAFGSSDPFTNEDAGFASFESNESSEFQDDGFGMDAFSTPDQKSAWEKRENWKNNGARSRSGDVPKKSERRKGGTPRKCHSSDNIRLHEPDEGPSPRVSRKKPSSSRRLDSDSGERSSISQQKSSDKSPRQRERKSDHSPVRRTRSGARPSRRASMDNSGHTHRSEATSQSSDSQPRPAQRAPRRGSLGYTNSDGSLEPAATSKIPPARNKSVTGPAHRPAGGRRQRRSELSQTSSGKLDFMQMNLPPRKDDSSVENDNVKEDDGKKDKKWDHERSKNQEKIMEMYRGGELLSKSDHKLNDSSLGDLDKHIDMMAIPDEQGDASSDRGSRKGSRVLRRSKKTDKEKEDDGYKEPVGRKDRTKGSLLDRVAGDSRDFGSKSGHDSVQSSGGLSYSDKIMKAQQQRSKGN